MFNMERKMELKGYLKKAWIETSMVSHCFAVDSEADLDALRSGKGKDDPTVKFTLSARAKAYQGLALVFEYTVLGIEEAAKVVKEPFSSREFVSMQAEVNKRRQRLGHYTI